MNSSMPPSPALDSKYPQVPNNIKKALLQIIERSGTPVFDINLKDICDRNHEVFGASGFDRRGLQFYFGNLRRKLTIQKWAHILDKAKVPHGEATTRLLRLEERQPSPKTVASEEEATEEELSADTEADPVDLRAQFENLSISSPPAAFKNSSHPARFSPLRSALKTPPRNYSPALPPSYSKMATPNEDPSGYGLPSSVSSSGFSETSFLGSKLNPNRIYVQTAFPERNGEFDIVQVPTIRCGKNDTYSGVHIKRDVAPDDYNKWSMKMYESKAEPELTGRAVLVRGPSRSHWHDEIDGYHRADFCPTTKNVHSSAAAKIANDEERKWKYWLLIFGAPTLFDNSIFSHHPLNVRKEKRGVEKKVKSKRGNERVHYCVFASWVIADKDGGITSPYDDDDSSTDTYGGGGGDGNGDDPE